MGFRYRRRFARAMADPVQTLNEKLDKLIAALAPLNQFVDQWTLREQRPGMYNKFPVALPFRPAGQNSTVILALGVADVSANLEVGLYDITADADCFFALNAIARLDGGYPLRAGLVYGGLRISAQDVLHIIAAAAGGNVYFSKVE
jgi:hypothetical protein